MEVRLWRILRDMAVGGVDFSMAENGGTDCVNYLPAYQRCLETIVFTFLGLCGIYYGMGGLERHLFHKHKNNAHKKYANGSGLMNGNAELINGITATSAHSDQKMAPFVSRILISLSPIYRIFSAHGSMFFMFYAGVFMIELFYKIVTRTMVFVLQPCHICTTLQLVLIRFRNEKRLPWTQKLFRFQLYTLPGALIALLFPMIDTRLMVGEVFIFYLQHALILITPLHLMLTTDFYKPESLKNVSWPIFSISIIVLYHFLLLQSVGLLTHANLNCIMCPAATDPFKGRFYRVVAVLLQSFIVIPFFTKCYSYVSTQVILKVSEKQQF